MRAVASRWWLLIPGFVGGADWIFGLVHRWFPAYEPPVTGDIGVVILFAAGFIAASYWAFHDQRQELVALGDRLDLAAKRVKLKETLGALLAAGGALIEQKAPEEQVTHWADLGRKVILDAFGSGEVQLFLSDHGYPSLIYHSKYPYITFIENRRRRLTELIARLDSIQIRPESDPDRIVRVLPPDEFERMAAQRQTGATSDQPSISPAISSQDQT